MAVAVTAMAVTAMTVMAAVMSVMAVAVTTLAVMPAKAGHRHRSSTLTSGSARAGVVAVLVVQPGLVALAVAP